MPFASGPRRRLGPGVGSLRLSDVHDVRLDQGGEGGARSGTRRMGSDHRPWGEGRTAGAKASDLMQWLRHLINWRSDTPQADREAFERREAELRDRHERLERLAVEADVISRSDTPEGQPW